MFKTIALFEFYQRIKTPQFWIFALALFLFTLLPLVTSVQIGATIGNVDRASDFIVIRQALMMGILGALFVGLMTGPTVTKDHESGFSALLYAMPLKRVSFILGRFAGSFAAAIILLSFILLSVSVAALMMEGRLPNLSGLTTAYFVFLIPSAFIVSAISFSLTTLSGRSQISIVTTIALFTMYTLAQSFVDPIDSRNVLSWLADPFGWSVLSQLTEYWTLTEKNTQELQFGSELWLNRLFWLGTASSFLLATVSFRSMTLPNKKSAKQDKSKDIEFTEALSSATLPLSRSVNISQSPILPLIIHELKIIKTIPFMVLLGLGLVNYFNTVLVGLPIFYEFQPLLTSTVIADATFFNLPMSLFLIMTYCTGEMMWGDRKSGYYLLKDSMPSSKFQILTAKLITGLGVVTGIGLLVIVLGVICQLIIGDAPIELAPYLSIIPFNVILPAFSWVFMGLFIQSLVSNRYIGYFFMVLVMMQLMFMSDFGVENHLFLFGQAPSAQYTDFMGYGHFLQSLAWFNVYWLAFGATLFSVALVFFNRGIQRSIRERLANLKSPENTIYFKSFVSSMLFLVLVGGYIHYNTAVINEFQPKSFRNARAANYEKTYQHLRSVAQPKIIDADLDVAFYPSKSSVKINGTYTLENRTDQAIEKLFVSLRDIEVVNLKLHNGKLVNHDKTLGVYEFEFNQPLLTSQKAALKFSTQYVEKGFKSQKTNKWVIENGSIINNLFANQGVYFPHIGYASRQDLTPKHIRAEYGLKALKLEDAANGKGHLFGDVADWITYRAVVSTNTEQSVVAPGNLVKTWQADGRKYSQFESSKPMLNAYVFASAKYDIKTVKWNDVDIVVYSHPGHDYNIDTITESVKATLEFYSDNIASYPFNRLNIIEVPRYRFQGQSYPGILTLTTSFGFLQKKTDDATMNWLAAVVAHELGHQWWMNQEIPARLPGATLMTEMLSNYGHLQIGDNLYGEQYVDNLLKSELSRYLKGRGQALETETPLSKNLDQIVGDYAYIDYSKGSLATHAIGQIIGVDNFNASLKVFLEKYSYSTDYPKINDFVKILLAHSPVETHDAIDIWLNRVAMFKHSVLEAKSINNANGNYELTFKVNAERIEYDTRGNKQPTSGVYDLDIQIFDEDGTQIAEEVVSVTADADGSITVKLTLKVKPSSIALDPNWKWLEVNRSDNLIKL